MSESYEDQLSRVEQMAEDDGCTWDLSPNDQAALKAVLAEIERLRAELAWARADRDGWSALYRGVQAASRREVQR